jgi:hypothetical protein
MLGEKQEGRGKLLPYEGRLGHLKVAATCWDAL